MILTADYGKDAVVAYNAKPPYTELYRIPLVKPIRVAKLAEGTFAASLLSDSVHIFLDNMSVSGVADVAGVAGVTGSDACEEAGDGSSHVKLNQLLRKLKGGTDGFPEIGNLWGLDVVLIDEFRGAEASTSSPLTGVRLVVGGDNHAGSDNEFSAAVVNVETGKSTVPSIWPGATCGSKSLDCIYTIRTVKEWSWDTFVGGCSGDIKPESPLWRLDLVKNCLDSPLFTEKDTPDDEIEGLDADALREILFVACSSGIRMWSHKDGCFNSDVLTDPGMNAFSSVVAHPEKHLVFAGEVGPIYAWDVRYTKSHLLTFKPSDGCVYDMARVDDDVFVSVASDLAIWKSDGSVLKVHKHKSTLEGVCSVGNSQDRLQLEVIECEDFVDRCVLLAKITDVYRDDFLIAKMQSVVCSSRLVALFSRL